MLRGGCLVGGLAEAAIPLLVAAGVAAQQIPLAKQPFNEFALRRSGQPVIPIFDGWYANADGTRSICFGYKNLNLEEALDIPLGPDNFIEPSVFDGLQPTHFAPAPESLDPHSSKAKYRRQYCVFTVRVPEDFGSEQVVWTLRVRGETISNPGNLLPAYVVDEPVSDARGAVAPVIAIGDDERRVQGRNGMTVGPYLARAGVPLPITISVEQPGGRTWVGWFHHQGAGTVTFGVSEQVVEGSPATAATTATFSEPGEFVLLVQAISTVADFEFICCWTNAWIRVTVEAP